MYIVKRTFLHFIEGQEVVKNFEQLILTVKPLL